MFLPQRYTKNIYKHFNIPCFSLDTELQLEKETMPSRKMTGCHYKNEIGHFGVDT